MGVLRVSLGRCVACGSGPVCTGTKLKQNRSQYGSGALGNLFWVAWSLDFAMGHAYVS